MKLSDAGIKYAAPDLMCVCIDGAHNSDIYGILYCNGRADGVEFRSGSQLLLEMEKWCDYLGFPQCEVKMRSFSPALNRRQGREERRGQRERAGELMSDDILSRNGEGGTFLVHIKYRQNATWQGQVTWVEKKETQNFRSALELLKLFDSALEEKEAGQEEAGGRQELE